MRCFKFYFLLARPFRMLRDVLEFRRLRRLMPTTPRMWVREPRRGMRPESDAEYLDRLKQLAVQRFAPQQTGKFRGREPQQDGHRADTGKSSKPA